jgi:hypothetical protein
VIFLHGFRKLIFLVFRLLISCLRKFYRLSTNIVEQDAGYNLVEGKEEKGKERDDNDCGGGDLESQLFIYMTQPRRCAPQAVPHSSASGSEQLCNYGLAPSEWRWAAGHQAGTRRDCSSLAPANVLTF